MFYFVAWSDREGGGIEQDEWRAFCGAQPGVDLDSQFRHQRNRDNGYLQDRQAMQAGDFTGMRGIPVQDMAMWETMGAIADR
jgi:phthalate 4,5-dioxygenase oxygenase subunit